MLIAGAGGHTKDILVTLLPLDQDIVFFDDITNPPPKKFLRHYRVINSLAEAAEYLENESQFIIGIGGTTSRKKIYEKLISVGGDVKNFVAQTASIGTLDVRLGKGLNIMGNTMISNSVRVGTGSLINTRALLHHDVILGDFCEIGPGAIVLGGVKIGDFSRIGAGVTILPKVKVGRNCIVGAGSVVTRDVKDNLLVVGVPAEKKKNLSTNSYRP